jgi:hypothetical protein
MSKTGQWRMGLQELPEYEQGHHARMRGEAKATGMVGLIGNALTAYGLGWEDADTEMRAP